MKRKMVGIFKLNENAKTPERATRLSACYDLFACLNPYDVVKSYDVNNIETPLVVPKEKEITINPGDRVLVPTGCKFKIPHGYSIRLHPRSGLSLKNGISLSNCEGVIDEDYTKPTFMLLTNESNIPFPVKHGDRLTQMELVPVIEIEFEPVPDFGDFTDRKGGLGSTGTGA
jgi:dUTP pyrophosphatase